jgi:hypothetical protein
MKPFRFRAVVGSVLLLVCAVGAASAQSIFTAKWDVPFPFALGKAILPAGECVIRSTNSSNNWSILSIQNQHELQSAYLTVTTFQQGKTSENSKLVFHQYENQYFLAQVCIRGEETGRELPMTKAEREVAKELKHAHPSQAKIVTLVAENQQGKPQIQ